MRAAWAAWRATWFHPVSARGVAVLRVALGLLLFDQLLALWPELPGLVGPDAMVSVEAARSQLPRGRWTPFDDLEQLQTLHAWTAAAVAAAVLFTVGLGARAAAQQAPLVAQHRRADAL